MKRNIGDDGWAASMLQKRAAKLGTICTWLARVSSAEAATYLLRYQSSRLVHTARTTPATACGSALRAADATVGVTLESILGCELRGPWASGFGAPSAMDDLPSCVSPTQQTPRT